MWFLVQVSATYTLYIPPFAQEIQVINGIEIRFKFESYKMYTNQISLVLTGIQAFLKKFTKIPSYFL